MQSYIEILILVIIGIILLWFGYTLLMGAWSGIRLNMKYRYKPRKKGTASPGDPQVCPICCSKLNKGDLVKTHAFPSITGGRDRSMHVRGCVHCLSGGYDRRCPVCGTSLGDSDFLVARMFDRHHRRPHVHVMGCNRCKRVGQVKNKYGSRGQNAVALEHCFEGIE